MLTEEIKEKDVKGESILDLFAVRLFTLWEDAIEKNFRY